VTYTQLKRAVDAASVAAANNVKISTPGETYAQRKQRVTEAAREMLQLNNVTDIASLEVYLCDDSPLPPDFDICPPPGEPPRKLAYVRATQEAPVYFLHLFGIDPRHMVNFEKNSELLNTVPDIPAPKVLSKAELDGKEYLVVEKMRGKALESFTGQPEELLYQFGIWLAKVHRSRANFFGNIAKTSTEHKDRFHSRLAETIKMMAEREYPEDSKIRKVSGNILEELKSLPVPDWFCPIMPDMSSSQFLADEGRISAIVDIEAYVVGPRILDFIALEYVLDKEASRPFLEGYCSMLDVPPLSGYRKVYRYFYLLLGIQGTVDLDEWMAQPELF
jgi:hypothetical protein